MAAHATDAVPQGSGNAASASGKHDLISTTVPGAETSDLISTGDCTYVVWKVVLHLLRPRAKIQRPAIYFTAHLTVRVEALKSIDLRAASYLRSFEPLPANVLEPLRFDPSLGQSNIYLPETRITKVAPSAARTYDDVKPIRSTSRRAFPIVPALFTRIRYSALPDAVIASLHLETTHLVSGTVVINDVDVNVPIAEVENLCPLVPHNEARAGDETVLLYKLPRIVDDSSQSGTAVFVRIEAVVSTDQGSLVELDIRWQAPVDLSQTVSKPNYKWSRPLSGAAQHVSRPSLHATEKSTSLDLSPKASTGESGITFNFTAAPTTIRNEEFIINVQCINRSARARRFALVVVQPKRTHMKSQHQQQGSEDETLIANLFNAPPRERPRPPDVLDLNPDVRVGPLPPGACFETQMKFRATATGVLDLGVVRIVDLDTRQTVDVRELPDVIALEATEGGVPAKTKENDS